jgi:uncharacterized membrane protein
MKNPKLKINLSKVDYVLEFFSWSAIISIWTIFIINYKNLPQIIPTHYDMFGNADKHGEKYILIFLPIIASIIFIVLSIFIKYPHIMNYQINITNENAENQYKISIKMLRVLKINITIIFILILFKTITNAENNTSNLGQWFLPVVLILIFIPVVYFTIKANKIK